LDTAIGEIHLKYAYSAIISITKEPRGGFDNITIVCYNDIFDLDKQFLCENLSCKCSNLIPGTLYNATILTNKNNKSRRNGVNLEFYTSINFFLILMKINLLKIIFSHLFRIG
jgi:hypothetical protein